MRVFWINHFLADYQLIIMFFFRYLHLFLFSKAMLSGYKSYDLSFRKLFFCALKVMLLSPESIGFTFLACIFFIVNYSSISHLLFRLCKMCVYLFCFQTKADVKSSVDF